MLQMCECASSLPACGLEREGQDLAAWEGPLDGPEQKVEYFTCR